MEQVALALLEMRSLSGRLAVEVRSHHETIMSHSHRVKKNLDRKTPVSDLTSLIFRSSQTGWPIDC
jgi:hypothetical protein